MRLTEFYKEALSDKPRARKQENVWSCAPAAVKAVLEHFGYYVPEARLSKMMSTLPQLGTYHAVFKQIFDQYGLYTNELNKANYEQLVAAAQKDCPIITDFHNQYGNHYVTVLQANNNGVEFLDTALDQGTIRRLPKESFIKQWYNTFTPPKTISRGWMIAVFDGQEKTAVSGKHNPLEVQSPLLQETQLSNMPAAQLKPSNKGVPQALKKQQTVTT